MAVYVNNEMHVLYVADWNCGTKVLLCVESSCVCARFY